MGPNVWKSYLGPKVCKCRIYFGLVGAARIFGDLWELRRRPGGRGGRCGLGGPESEGLAGCLFWFAVKELKFKIL